jgi:lactoylglutathione lyase
MKGITSIAHAAVRVKDIDRSLDFYVGKLGFDEMFRLYRDDGSLWIVYLRITDDQYLELFPDGIGERAPVPETIGHNHFCLAVDDMDKVIAQLTAAGVPLSRPKKVGADLNIQCWIVDPDGVRIEFMQVVPGCMQLEAIERLKKERVA